MINTVPTLLGAGCSALLGIVSYAIISHKWGAAAFGEYQLARAVMTVGIPVTTLGLIAGLQRYVAVYVGAGRRDHNRLFRKALLVVVIAASTSGCVFVLLPSQFIGLPALSSAPTRLAIAIALAVLAFDQITQAYLRGLGKYWVTAIAGVGAVGLAPLVGAAFANSIAGLFLLQGMVGAVFVIWLFAVVITNRRRTEGPLGDNEPHVPASVVGHSRVEPNSDGAFLRYSLKRAPTGIVAAGFFAVPVFMAGYLGGDVVAGTVGFGTTVLVGVSLPFSSVSGVMTPFLSRNLGKGASHERILAPVRYALLAACVSAIGMVLLALVLPAIVSLILGTRSASELATLRIMLIAGPFLAYYYSTRSFLAVMSTAPLEAYVLALSTVGGLATTVLLSDVLAAGPAVAAGMVSSSVLSAVCSGLMIPHLRRPIDPFA